MNTGMIKNTLRNYIELNDIGLSSLFKVIDTNSDQVLNMAEFMQKMKSLQVYSDENEIIELYKLLDKTGTGNITLKHFI